MKHLIIILATISTFTLNAQIAKFNFTDTFVNETFETSKHTRTNVKVSKYNVIVNSKVYKIKDTMYSKEESVYTNTAYQCTNEGKTYLIHVFKDHRYNDLLSVSVARGGVKTNFYNINQ